jgi:hypothetical protein
MRNSIVLLTVAIARVGYLAAKVTQVKDAKVLEM